MKSPRFRFEVEVNVWNYKNEYFPLSEAFLWKKHCGGGEKIQGQKGGTNQNCSIIPVTSRLCSEETFNVFCCAVLGFFLLHPSIAPRKQVSEACYATPTFEIGCVRHYTQYTWSHWTGVICRMSHSKYEIARFKLVGNLETYDMLHGLKIKLFVHGHRYIKLT